MICGRSPRAYFSEIEKVYGNAAADAFLMNPTWTRTQREAADALVRNFAARSREIGRAPAGRIFVASGGSGGKIRFVAHTARTLEAGARGLISALKLPAGTPLNCFVCLPPWHVSGLTPLARSRVSGGKLFVAEDGGFHGGALPDFRGNAREFWMNSLVPAQLRRILEMKNGAAWLRTFDFILLGGSSVPAELIARAEAEKLNVGIGYGMTETAALVALWRLGDGAEIAGTPLPHAKISVSEKDSRIAISAESLGETLGANGELLPNTGGVFRTNDEGRIDSRGRIVVLGRADRYICSGGEKIDPAQVEAALRSAGARAALVVGEPDAEWGERVVAVVAEPVPADILARARRLLPGWMAPKRLVRVPALPLDGKGKIDRDALNAALAAPDED